MAYLGPLGSSQLPQTTFVDNLGQKHVSSGAMYNVNHSTGQVTELLPKAQTSDGRVGVFTSGTSGTGTSTGTGTSGVASVLGSSTPAKTSAESAYEKALATLNGGVDYAKEAVGRTQQHIMNADSDLGSARVAADSISGSIGNVNRTSQSLGGYADILRNLGIGTTGIGDAIIRGDTSGGGLVSEFLNSIGLAGDAALKINPDNYVSMAAADTQSSYQNALDQALRGLSRSGVSESSGAAGALRGQFAQLMATAMAAAKTKARMVGLSDQVSALSQRAGLFKDALTTGTAIQQQGAQNIAQAAGIVEKQGDLFATAGQLSQAQSAAYANIGGVEVNLGQLELSDNNAVQAALDNVANAQMEMAKYYADMMPVTQTTSGWQNGHYNSSTTTTTKG